MRLILRKFSSSFYDSQSGKYINSNVKTKFFDFTLLSNQSNDQFIKLMNKNHVILLPNISKIKLVKDFKNISISTSTIDEMNEIIRYNNDNKTNIQVTFNISNDNNQFNSLLKIANDKGIVTNSILPLNLDNNLDVNQVNNDIANLADMGSHYIILSIRSLPKIQVDEDDLIREIVENSFNIDVDNNAISSRLGLFFKDIKLLEIAKRSNIRNYGLDWSMLDLTNALLV